MTVRIGVLVPVQLAGKDAGGAAMRALLAALVLGGPGTARSVGALADDVWGEDQPQNPKAALQTLVSRVRAADGPDLTRSAPGGYAFGTEDTDLHRAGALAAEAAAMPDSDPVRIELLETAGGLGDAPSAGSSRSPPGPFGRHSRRWPRPRPLTTPCTGISCRLSPRRDAPQRTSRSCGVPGEAAGRARAPYMCVPQRTDRTGIVRSPASTTTSSMSCAICWPRGARPTRSRCSSCSGSPGSSGARSPSSSDTHRR